MITAKTQIPDRMEVFVPIFTRLKSDPLLLMNSISQLLILHHSHTDIGYTHSQPAIWRLHARYIDEALDLCEHTSDWPEYSRARWTCEITSPVLRWLERAP